MHKNKFLLAALLFLPFVAQAASSANIGSTSCSGSLSSALGEEAFFLCSGGDLSLIGGSITSDAAVILHADGSLFLDKLSITAPTIELQSFGGSITVDSGTFLSGTFRAIVQPVELSSRGTLPTGSGATLQISPGGDLSLYSGVDITGAVVGSSDGAILPTGRGGTLQISPGGDLSLSGGGDIVILTSAVPEPSVALMMFLGLLPLIGVGAGRKRRGSGLVS